MNQRKQFYSDLKRVLGSDTIQCALSYPVGFRGETEQDPDDWTGLTVIVPDLKSEDAGNLVQQVRGRSKYRDYPVLSDVLGYEQFRQQLARGIPDASYKLDRGEVLGGNDDTMDTLRSELHRGENGSRDRTSLSSELNRRANDRFRQVQQQFRDHLMTLYRSVLERCQAEVIGNARDDDLRERPADFQEWEDLRAQLEDLGFEETNLDVLEKIRDSAGAISLYEKPEIGGELYDLFNRLRDVFARMSSGSQD